uniref:Tubulin-specific chaperone E n=1 Tax=Timema cristinae TaxID=61476 RepID=A0A7R9D8T2_TIMCR|nr:unnamed protein product [Timema cristinae]
MNMCPTKREAVETSSSNFLHPETECLSCDFVSAVMSRYTRRSQDQLRADRDECLDDVELDNTEPSSQSYERMNILILSGLHISRPGPEGSLKGLFSNVTELYLRHNLFISWEDVATITSQLPRLDLLDMTGNRLKLSQLRTLHSQPQITRPASTTCHDRLSRRHPNVHAQKNGPKNFRRKEDTLNPSVQAVPKWSGNVWKIPSRVDSLPLFILFGLPPLPVWSLHSVFPFQFITRLVLGDMCYTWLDVLVCSTLSPQLTELYCTNNSITKIDSPTFDNFSHLQVLDLSNNNITCWEQVNNLGRLSSLRYLNLQGCSLQDITFPDCCIGGKSEFFRRLSRLNISDNSIRSWQHVAELDKQPALRELRLMRNPLDEGKKQDYIREMIIVNVGSIIKLNGSHLDLTFISRSGPNIPIKVSVPDTMSILRVRSLSRKLFNTGTQLPRVSYISTKMLGKEIALDDDLSDLHFFSVENEDTIVVHS